jgi:hypothetical protein
MSTLIASTEMELTYSAYLERQYHEISTAGIAAAVERLRPADKFSFQAGQWYPEPYVGHALVAMVEGDSANTTLKAQLASIENELSYNYADPTTLCLLPGHSFHQTIANTLSADRYQRLVVERGLESQYPGMVTSVLADLPEPASSRSLSLRMVGLSIFSSAIGLLGVFEEEEDFQRVVNFRDLFYGHQQVGNLGIRRTRPFIGHVTLAYVGGPLDSVAKARLADIVGAINRVIQTRDLRFHLPRVELRAYQHLGEFRALPGLPTARL